LGNCMGLPHGILRLFLHYFKNENEFQTPQIYIFLPYCCIFFFINKKVAQCAL
jgi:hypothetical protein